MPTIRKKGVVAWTGPPPTKCDICGCELGDTFVDGRTKHGPWANMCGVCHREHGVGLGLGKGQKYLRTFEAEHKERRFLKKEG